MFAKLGTPGALSSGNFFAATSASFLNPGTAGNDPNDYIKFETDTGKLYYDTNGNAPGGVTQIALLHNSVSPLALTADDIIVT